MADGHYRGWADRLAELIAHAQPGRAGLRYANLAVRSRRIQHVVCDQIPRAIELRADLVSVLVGGNDLVKLGAEPVALAARLGDGIRRLRASGCEVLLLTPFLPRRRASLLLAKRFAIFNSELRSLARTSGAVLLDVETVPPIGDLSLWADDAVHLNPRGHRMLAYEAATRLGVPDAQPLGLLEESLHADDIDEYVAGSGAEWLRDHALRWVLRRLRGRTAGDGLQPKHTDLVTVGGTSSTQGRQIARADACRLGNVVRLARRADFASPRSKGRSVEPSFSDPSAGAKSQRKATDRCRDHDDAPR